MQHLAPEPYAAWKRGIAEQALSQAHIDAELLPLVDAHEADGAGSHCMSAASTTSRGPG